MQYEIDCQDCAFFGITKVCFNCDSGEFFTEAEAESLDFNNDDQVIIEDDEEETENDEEV